MALPAIVGRVEQVTGEVKAVNAEGHERLLTAGDVVMTGERVVSGRGAALTVLLADGSRIEIGSEASVMLDDEVLGEDHSSDAISDTTEFQAAIEQSLAQGEEIDALLEELDPTAAGGTAGSGGAQTYIEDDTVGTADASYGVDTSGPETETDETETIDISSLRFQPGSDPTAPDGGTTTGGDTGTTGGDGDDVRNAVVVEDDGGFQVGGPTVTAQVVIEVHEDALASEDTADPGRDDASDGIRDHASDTDEGSGVGDQSLASLVDLGSGTLAFFRLVDGLTDPGLTSKGEPVTYHIETFYEPEDLSVIARSILTARAGDREIFTFRMDKDGNYYFDLDDQVDHPTAEGTDGLALDYDNAFITFDIGQFIEAVDTNGDTLRLTNAVQVSIENDVPEIVSEGMTIGGDEASGDFSHLVLPGADEDLTFVLIEPFSTPSLTSDGQDIAFNVSQDIDDDGDVLSSTLTATTGEGQDASTVFTLNLSSDGAFEYSQEAEIDPDSPGLDGDSELDLGAFVIAYDTDNDAVWLKDLVTVDLAAEEEPDATEEPTDPTNEPLGGEIPALLYVETEESEESDPELVDCGVDEEGHGPELVDCGVGEAELLTNDLALDTGDDPI